MKATENNYRVYDALDYLSLVEANAVASGRAVGICRVGFQDAALGKASASADGATSICAYRTHVILAK